MHRGPKLTSCVTPTIIFTVSSVLVELNHLAPLILICPELDSSEPLRFAYSCTRLILAHRTLQHMNYSHIVNENDEQATAMKKVPFIQEAILHSQKLINAFLSMSDLTTYIHPAYETLLSSFAMVTLAEFVSHIPDTNETVNLMEEAISHIQQGGKAEPVSRWSLNIIRQHLVGRRGEGEPATLTMVDNSIFGPLIGDEALGSLDQSGWNFEQEFPSLQDMFSGNVA